MTYLGHSGQWRSVKCDEALWFTKSGGLVHYKSLACVCVFLFLVLVFVCLFFFIRQQSDELRHKAATGSHYCCYAPVLHWFCVVISSILVQDKTGKAWTSGSGDGGLRRITYLSANYVQWNSFNIKCVHMGPVGHMIQFVLSVAFNIIDQCKGHENMKNTLGYQGSCQWHSGGGGGAECSTPSWHLSPGNFCWGTGKIEARKKLIRTRKEGKVGNLKWKGKKCLKISREFFFFLAFCLLKPLKFVWGPPK